MLSCKGRSAPNLSLQSSTASLLPPMTLQQLAPLPSLVGLSRRAREHDRHPDRCSSICGNPMNLGSPSPRRRRPIAYEPFLLAPRRRRGMHCSLACRPTIPPRVGCARSAHSANAQRPEPKLLQSSPGGSSACRPAAAPIAKPRRQPPPFAAMLDNILNGVARLAIREADLAPLPPCTASPPTETRCVPIALG